MKIYRESGGGVSGSVPYIELMTSVDWGDLFSKNLDRDITFCTYGLPYEDYFDKYLPQMKSITAVIGTNKYVNKEAAGKKYKKLNPNSDIHFMDNTHAKVVLFAPDDVYLSSQNLYPADWLQATVHIKDEYVYNFYKGKVSDYIADPEHNTSNIAHSLDMERMYPCENYNPKDMLSVLAPIKPAPPLRTKGECNLARQINWKQKFTGVHNQRVVFLTFDIPDEKYAADTIGSLLSRDNSVYLVVNSKFQEQAYSLSERVNSVYFKWSHAPNTHVKMALLENKSVWISSQNFGDSSWFEAGIQITKNEAAFNYYNNKIMDQLGFVDLFKVKIGWDV